MREDEKTSNNSIRDTEQVPSNSLLLSRNGKKKEKKTVHIKETSPLFSLFYGSRSVTFADSVAARAEYPPACGRVVMLLWTFVKSVANSVVNIYYVAEQRHTGDREEGERRIGVALYENKERERERTREPHERVVPVASS